MIEFFREVFSNAFLARTLVVGLLVSLCASLLGVSLVLKQYSMIGAGLSHVGFGALGVATALNVAPLLISVPVVVAAALLLMRIRRKSKVKGAAAIAIVSAGALAGGVIVLSLTTGMTTDVSSLMFGSILAMSKGDAWLSVILSLGVLAALVVFYNKIFAVAFDESFGRAAGTNVGLYNTVLVLLTAVTVALGMRMMGAMLITSIIIFPALSAIRVCVSFKQVAVTSAVVGVVCYLIGVVLSYVCAIPTGASVVGVNVVAFLLFLGVEQLLKRIPK